MRSIFSSRSACSVGPTEDFNKSLPHFLPTFPKRQLGVVDVDPVAALSYPNQKSPTRSLTRQSKSSSSGIVRAIVALGSGSVTSKLLGPTLESVKFSTDRTLTWDRVDGVVISRNEGGEGFDQQPLSPPIGSR